MCLETRPEGRQQFEVLQKQLEIADTVYIVVCPKELNNRPAGARYPPRNSPLNALSSVSPKTRALGHENKEPPMVTEEQVLAALSVIIDPDLHKDIVTLGFVKKLSIDQDTVSFAVELTTPACPIKAKFKDEAEQVVMALPDVNQVKVTMTSRSAPRQTKAEGLKNVNSIIAVASCKGGVGKSTIAATIARELANRDFRVGLLDADLFGPSIPTLLGIQHAQVMQQGQLLMPIDADGLKVMSFGFLLGDAPAIMRGPMVANYTQQLLNGVDWGTLDYLILDMPPGTGDVQLTIAQTVQLDGAVIVTTRATLSLIDVVRGILMFEKVDVPLLGVVENMSSFICDGCGKEHAVFGEQTSSLSDRFGLKTLAQIPLDARWAKTLPTNLDDSRIGQLVDAMVRQLGTLSAQKFAQPEISTGPKEVTIRWPEADEWVLDNFTLRSSCRCAHCIDEFSGVKKLNPQDIPADIHATASVCLGNYAISITWSDGHSSSIYAYGLLRQLGQVRPEDLANQAV